MSNSLNIIGQVSTDTALEPEILAGAQKVISQTFPSENAVQKVLFVHPPDCTTDVFKYEVAKRGGYYNFPPYGLGVLASKVRSAGYEAKISGLHQEVLSACRASQSESEFEYDGAWQSRLLSDIEEFRPDVVAVTCLFTMTYRSFLNVVRFIKSIKSDWIKSPNGLPIAMGGVHITQFMHVVVQDLPEAEFIFPNEGEGAFVNFLEVANHRRKVEELAGIVINDNGTVLNINKLLRPSAEDINIIPAYDLMQVQNYSKVGRVGSFDWTRERGTTFASVLTNRGCRAACTFCNVRNFSGKGVRQRSIDSVIDELKTLVNTYGVRHITWLDDDLLHDESRAISLFNEIIKNNLNITWDAMNGVIARSCTEEVVSAMAASGCRATNIGVESGNAQIQHQIQKPGNSKIFLQAAEVFRRHPEINARVFLMVGFPGETFGMIGDTLTLAQEMNLDWYSITILQPWLSTPMYEAMAEQGLIEERQDRIEGRYSAGPFGQQRGFEESNNINLDEFRAFFQGAQVNEIPSKDKLLDIWFWMNYYLNFHRLFTESRRIKLEQQARALRNITDLVAPSNGFGMYFDAYLQNRLGNQIPETLTARLENRLLESNFWSNTFRFLGFSADHLRLGNFPERRSASAELSISHLNQGWFRKQQGKAVTTEKPST